MGPASGLLQAGLDNQTSVLSAQGTEGDVPLSAGVRRGASAMLPRVRYRAAASRHPSLAYFAPAVLFDLNAVFLSRGLNTFPGRISLGVPDVLHLIEGDDGVANVAGSFPRLPTLLWEKRMIHR